MHVLQALQHLVNNVLLVNVFKYVSPDNCVQISIHKVEHQINISIVLSPNYVLQSNYVLVPCQLL